MEVITNEQWVFKAKELSPPKHILRRLDKDGKIFFI